MRMRFILFAAFGLVAATPVSAAGAADPCAAFAWPLGKERILLGEAAGTTVSAGSYLHQDPPVGFRLLLKPDARVVFVQSPQKSPAPGGYGGVVKIGSPTTHGAYLVTLSTDGSVDVIQGSGAVVSDGASSAKNCPGMHKSVRVLVDSGAPLTLQISGAPNPEINIAVTPSEYFNARPPGED